MSPRAAAGTARAGTARRLEDAPRRVPRPHLRLVTAARRRRADRPAHRRLELLAATLFAGSLLTVVVAHTVEAADQVRLSNAQAQLAAEQANHRQLQLKVAQLEAPQRIARAAAQQHLAEPAQVQQLPYTPLNKPLAQPNLTPVPPPTTATTTATAATTATTTPSASTQPTASTSPASSGSAAGQ